MIIKLLQKGHNCVDSLIIIDGISAQFLEENEAYEVYRKDADVVFDVLVNSLPGGTYDELCNRIQRYRRQNARELGESWSCRACGWKGFTPIFEPNFMVRCPNCEYEATPHREE